MKSKSYFNRVAGQWDEMRSGFFSEKVRERAFEVADIESGKLAADIGAGTGFITEGLIRERVNVVAIDQSEAMINELKRKFKMYEGFSCRTGQAEKLPIPPEHVDYVFANMYLHHVDDPLASIKEMSRILKSGGKLVITDLDEHDFEFLREEQHDRWLGFKREDLKDWFSKAGLNDVVIDCVNQDCCADSGDGSKNAKISIFIASGVKV